MKFDYAPLAQDALDMIEEFGVEMILIKDGTDGYDPVTGEHNDPEPGGRLPFMGVRTEITEEYAATVGTDAIQKLDMLIILGNSVRPRLEDSLEIDGEKLDIVNVVETKPGDTTLLWTLQVRP